MDADSNLCHPRNMRLISEQVVADVSNDLPELEGLFFDQLRPLERSGAELFELHQLSIRQDHSHPVVQIMEPFSDLGLIHRATNLTRGLLPQVHRFLHDLVRQRDDARIGLISTLERDDLCQFRREIHV